MPHIRQLIREAIAEQLDGLALSVHTNRVADLDSSDLPAALVTVANETSELTDKDGDVRRVVDVFIDVITDRIDEGIDDALDDYAVLVEGRMNTLFDGLVYEVQLVSTEFDFRSVEEGDRWFASVSLNYQVVALTPEGDPTTVVT